MLSLVVGVELGRTPEPMLARVRSAQIRLVAESRAAARVLPPVVLRMEQATSGKPFGQAFEVVDVLEADAAVPGGEQARLVNAAVARMRAGKKWEREQATRYAYSQIYVEKPSMNGYVILDALGPRDPKFSPGPVSQKFTPLADVRIDSAIGYIREAYNKYRPGLKLTTVTSNPEMLRGTVLTGQLWLEIPVQSKPVPEAILAVARQLSVKIRDVEGKIY